MLETSEKSGNKEILPFARSGSFLEYIDRLIATPNDVVFLRCILLVPCK
jgi:hypothetical protein